MAYTGILGTQYSALGSLILGSPGSATYSSTITLSTTNSFVLSNTFSGPTIITLSTIAGFSTVCGFHIVFPVSNSLALHQGLFRNLYYSRNILSRAFLKSTPGRTIIVNLTPTSQVRFSQGPFKAAKAISVLSLQHSARWSVPVFQYTSFIRFKQSIGRTFTSNRLISESIGVKQTLGRTIKVSKTVSSAISLSHVVKLGKSLVVSNHFHPYHTLTYLRLVPTGPAQTLNLGQSVVVTKTKLLAASNTLNLIQGQQKFWATGEVYIDPPKAVKIVQYTVLKGPSGVIVLRPPNLSDTQNYGADLQIKYSVVGDMYTYIRDGETFVLKYTWSLDRKKALELRQFLISNYDSIITIENWKGEIWRVYINTAPSLMPKYFAERTDLTLEFEGVRIS